MIAEEAAAAVAQRPGFVISEVAELVGAAPRAGKLELDRVAAEPSPGFTASTASQSCN